jgi:hypothetical protein
MTIRWDDLPHYEIRLKIHRRHAQNAAVRGAQSSLGHILRRKLSARNSQDHQRFVELQAARLIEHLRCTRDIYQDFVKERGCRPVLEPYWVALRCAVFPTAVELLRQDVIEYTKLTQVPARDLSLLFGIPTHVCYKDVNNGFGVVYPPNLEDKTVASDTELQSLGRLLDDDALLHFEDVKDGGAVFRLFGGGPFAVDDQCSIRRSWSFSGLQQQSTLIEWMHIREKAWHLCSPWSDGLVAMFAAVQEELLSQHHELPLDSSLLEQALRFPRIIVPARDKDTSDGLDSDSSDLPRSKHVDAQQEEQDSPGLDARRAAIIRKVGHPQHYKTLMVEEATLYFEVARRTIYRWLEIGKLRSGARRGSITVESIRRLDARRSRRRHSNLS